MLQGCFRYFISPLRAASPTPGLVPGSATPKATIRTGLSPWSTLMMHAGRMAVNGERLQSSWRSTCGVLAGDTCMDRVGQ